MFKLNISFKIFQVNRKAYQFVLRIKKDKRHAEERGYKACVLTSDQSRFNRSR